MLKLMKSTSFKLIRRSLKILSAKSNYEKFHLFAIFPTPTRLAQSVNTLPRALSWKWKGEGRVRGSGRKSNLYAFNVFSYFYVYEFSFTEKFISPSSYNQKILLMCQIDIVIENAVDVFCCMFYLSGEKGEK